MKNFAKILFYALQCAKLDRIAFSDAVSNDPIAYKQAIEDVRQFEMIQKEIFGTSESRLDATLKKVKPVSIFDIRKLIELKQDNL